MQTNVYYAERPDRVIVTVHGDKAVIEFPVGITEEQTEDGTQWRADTVYSIVTRFRDRLKEAVEAGYEAWLNTARKRSEDEARKASKLTMDDLTEITVDQEYRICMLELGVKL